MERQRTVVHFLDVDACRFDLKEVGVIQVVWIIRVDVDAICGVVVEVFGHLVWWMLKLLDRRERGMRGGGRRRKQSRKRLA
jgi:hypothetical protein